MVPILLTTSAWGQNVRRSAPGPDEQLWAEIAALRDADPHAHDDPSRFQQRRQRYETCLEQIDKYLTLYPGGARRNQAIQLQLQASFELGVLGCGDFDRLCARAAELKQRPETPEIAAEAAYWLIFCRRNEHPPETAQPLDPLLPPTDADALREYAEYLDAFPDSRHTPRMATALFDEALQHDDRDKLRSLCNLLNEHHPGNTITERVVGRLARAEAVGQRFQFRGRSIDGVTIDSANYRGAPLVIAVWRHGDEDSVRVLRDIEQWRSQASAAAIGVNLDMSVDLCRATCRELSLAWPQVCDGRGRAGDFCRAYGVRWTPLVLVIDGSGVLRGSADGGGWRAIADAVTND